MARKATKKAAKKKKAKAAKKRIASVGKAAKASKAGVARNKPPAKKATGSVLRAPTSTIGTILPELDFGGFFANLNFSSQRALIDFQSALPGRPVPIASTMLPEVGSVLPQIMPNVTSDMLKTRLSSVMSDDPKALTKLSMNLPTNIDPRLQLAIANSRTGKRGPALSSTAGDEIAVIARVRSFDKWQSLAGVDAGVLLGNVEDGSQIVTGRIPVKRIEAIRADTNVVSLKASQPVYPSLAATVTAMGVGPMALPTGTAPKGGAGVVVGIVDFGCDFNHANFRNGGVSRIEAIWNQGASTQQKPGIKYGRLYSKADINAALGRPNPYTALGYSPGNEPGGAHGTHVMDIAAGHGRGTGQAGVAPQADLIFVEASSSDIVWQGPTAVGKSFGDSAQLLEAVRFIFDTAGDRPCVVNLSLGTNGGPHDGTSLVEQGLDAIVNERANRAVVIAASNSQEDGIHTSGIVPEDQTFSIGWKQMAAGGGEFELWYPGTSRLEVSLVAPGGVRYGPVSPGANLTLGDPGSIAIFISNRLDDPNNHDNAIGIWLAADLSDEDFTIELKSLDQKPVDFHAWIERDDQRQSSFSSPVYTHSLGSISTGHKTIVVGCYDGHKPAFPISSFSSAGPTRDGRQKPEVSAPGEFVVAAKSGSGDGATRKSGTSMSAPAVTGLIALMLAEAQRRGNQLTIDNIRDKLGTSASGNPPPGAPGQWNSQYGFGRANSGAVP
ncbi:hypothetical protein ABIF93_005792 [Bradyrhizobium japonicum]